MPGLAEFMDQRAVSGHGYARPRGTWRGSRSAGGSLLADSGPASRRVADAAADAAQAEQILAALFWWCKTRTTEFTADCRGYGGTPGERQIVVNHADGTRHDLLLLIPGGPPGFTATVSGPVYTRFSTSQGRPPTIAAVAQAESERMRDILTRAGMFSDTPTAVRAVAELAETADFRLVVAPSPDEIATGEWSAGAPAPALAVTVPGVRWPLATVGVIAAGVDGRLLAVTALHAIGAVGDEPGALLAGGQPASITGRHLLTDSCLLQVTCPAASTMGHAGALQFAPQEHRAATFEGAVSGRKQTMIRGYDLSVLAASPYLSSKVYTEADTVPGDSGAALIDHEDHLVGFAVSRTAFGASFGFSAWVWAGQVLSAHGLS